MKFISNIAQKFVPSMRKVLFYFNPLRIAQSTGIAASYIFSHVSWAGPDRNPIVTYILGTSGFVVGLVKFALDRATEVTSRQRANEKLQLAQAASLREDLIELSYLLKQLKLKIHKACLSHDEARLEQALEKLSEIYQVCLSQHYLIRQAGDTKFAADTAVVSLPSTARKSAAPHILMSTGHALFELIFKYGAITTPMLIVSVTYTPIDLVPLGWAAIGVGLSLGCLSAIYTFRKTNRIAVEHEITIIEKSAELKTKLTLLLTQIAKSSNSIYQKIIVQLPDAQQRAKFEAGIQVGADLEPRATFKLLDRLTQRQSTTTLQEQPTIIIEDSTPTVAPRL